MQAIEVFSIIICVIIDACIMLVSFKFKPPDQTYFISDVEKYRGKHCNTDNHIIAQFGFIFILSLLNSVEAIRARHLPQSFKETRIIILASLLSTVIVGNVIWLSFFQKNYYWKTIFIFYAIFLLNSINFIILYAYKVYIILYLPHLNTKKFFNKCVMKKIEKQAKEL